MKSTSRHADLVYDVGLHKGEDTDYYLKKGFRVVGFEADPDLSAHCRTRFADEIARGRLAIVEGAIVEPASGTKSIRFFKNPGASVWGTVSADWAQRNERLGYPSRVIEVPAIDFAACLEHHGIPHFMKIDIEGMDTVCLKTLLEFEHKPSYVSIESEKESFDKLRRDLDLFEQLGYTAFKAVQQTNIQRQREPNPSAELRYVGQRFEEGSSGLFGADLPDAWQAREPIAREYEHIFRQYSRFGDNGTLRRHLPGKVLRRTLSLFAGYQIPGWHDLHAKHSTASPAIARSA